MKQKEWIMTIPLKNKIVDVKMSCPERANDIKHNEIKFIF